MKSRYIKSNKSLLITLKSGNEIRIVGGDNFTDKLTITSTYPMFNEKSQEFIQGLGFLYYQKRIEAESKKVLGVLDENSISGRQ